MSGSPNGWRDLAELRQGLYRFLGGSLLPPDAERLEAMGAAADLLGELGIDDFAFAGAWHRVEEALDLPGAPEAVAADYVRLFLAGPDGPLCPPTESHHVREGGCGAGDIIVELQREYASIGLEVAPAAHLTADHLTTELEAMASLCHQEAHAWEEGAPAEAVSTLRREWSFLDRHLARWVPRFASRAAAAGGGGLYPAIAGAADAFVRHDHELVTTLTRARVDGLPG
jgi:TorA maturation chaperone TorD